MAKFPNLKVASFSGVAPWSLEETSVSEVRRAISLAANAVSTSEISVSLYKTARHIIP
jgi:hypothetical protein